MAASTFRPTRTHPHPSCRWTHNLTALLGVAIIAVILQAGLAFIVFVAAATILTCLGYAALRRKKFTETLNEDVATALEDASAHAPRVEIHRGWLITAVASDIATLILGAISAYLIGGANSQDTSNASPLVGIVAAAVGISLAIGQLWLNYKSHRCATTVAASALAQIASTDPEKS